MDNSRVKESFKRGEENKKRQSLKYSINDGFFHSVMVGLGESFITPFAIFLKATTSQIALLTSLPQLFGSFSQLLTPKLLEFFRSRKKVVATGVFFQALMWVPILSVFYLTGMAVPYLIFFVMIYWALGMLIIPAWSSWMGDLVDTEFRGRYLGVRNKVVGFASLCSLLVGGLILNVFQKDSRVNFTGFALIFLIALVARLISFISIVKEYEPKFVVYEGAKFSFFDFVKQMRFRNYGLFVIYLSLMNFSVNIAAPFFAVYMLKDLKFSYLSFTIVIAAALFMRIIFMPVWGRFIDKYGSKKILALSGYLMPLSPILWLFSSNIYYLILIQFYSGFVWSGFELASSNFIYDSTTSPKRARCVAYYNVINGVLILFGTLVGAYLVKHPFLFSSFMFVFLVSGIFRYVVSFVMIPKVKEVRTVADISYKDLFSKVMSVAPTQGITFISSLLNNKFGPFRKFR